MSEVVVSVGFVSVDGGGGGCFASSCGWSIAVLSFVT